MTMSDPVPHANKRKLRDMLALDYLVPYKCLMQLGPLHR